MCCLNYEVDFNLRINFKLTRLDGLVPKASFDPCNDWEVHMYTYVHEQDNTDGYTVYIYTYSMVIVQP